MNYELKTILAITGGIGSGKSTISKILHSYDIPVYDSDHEAKLLMNTNPQLKDQIRTHFGTESILPDGTINRPHIANIVFSSHEKLATLNSLVHPAVIRHFTAWSQQQTSPIVAIETALLIESGLIHHVHHTILVTASEETRIARATHRDNTTPEKIAERIATQTPNHQLQSIASFTISNNPSDSLLPQVYNIISHIPSKC